MQDEFFKIITREMAEMRIKIAQLENKKDRIEALTESIDVAKELKQAKIQEIVVLGKHLFSLHLKQGSASTPLQKNSYNAEILETENRIRELRKLVCTLKMNIKADTETRTKLLMKFSLENPENEVAAMKELYLDMIEKIYNPEIVKYNKRNNANLQTIDGANLDDPNFNKVLDVIHPNNNEYALEQGE